MHECQPYGVASREVWEVVEERGTPPVPLGVRTRAAARAAWPESERPINVSLTPLVQTALVTIHHTILKSLERDV